MRRKYILITIILSFMALAPGCAIGDKFYDVVASEDCLTFNSEASSSIVKIYEVPLVFVWRKSPKMGLLSQLLNMRMPDGGLTKKAALISIIDTQQPRICHRPGVW